MVCPKCGSTSILDDKICNKCGYVFFDNNIVSSLPEIIVENVDNESNNPDLPKIENSVLKTSSLDSNLYNDHPVSIAPIQSERIRSFSNDLSENTYPYEVNTNTTFEQSPSEDISMIKNDNESTLQPTIDSNNTMKIEINDTNTVVDKKENTNNSNILFIVIVAILSIIIVVFGILLVTKYFSNSSNGMEHAELGIEDTYKYDGFELPYLESYEKKVDDSGLLILFDYDHKIQMNINIVAGVVLEDFKEEANRLKELLVQAGYSVNSMDSKTINGVDWLLFQGMVVQQEIEYKYVYGYAMLGSNHVFETLIFDVTGNNSSIALESISKTIKNASYYKSTNYSIGENDNKDITIHHKDDSIVNDLKS